MKLTFPSELAIEDYVYGYIEDNGCCPITGDDVNIVLRQYEIYGYGITDIIKIIVKPGVVVVCILELKNEELKEAHLSQLCRYMAGAKRILRRCKRFMPKGWKIAIFGELAGPFMSQKNDFVYLLNELEPAGNINAYEISLSMSNGFESEEIGTGWYSTRESDELPRGLMRQVAGIIKDVRRGSENVALMPLQDKANG